MEKEIKLRKVVVLREVEVRLEEIKKGDVFRFEKASPEDPISNNQWMIAEEDAIGGLPTTSIKSINVALVPMAGLLDGPFRERT